MKKPAFLNWVGKLFPGTVFGRHGFAADISGKVSSMLSQTPPLLDPVFGSRFTNFWLLSSKELYGKSVMVVQSISGAIIGLRMRL